MTQRELDARVASIQYTETADLNLPAIEVAGDAFEAGAEWADGHPHWISVEDELPKMETEVLMVSSGCTDTLFGYRCKAGKNGWYCYNDDDYWHNITHWQHLPQPPKEGGEQ